MQTLLLDLHFALRTFRRRRTFAAVAVITIALGIGAATAIFSVVDGVVLKPLPFHDAGRLVSIWVTYPAWKREAALAVVSTIASWLPARHAACIEATSVLRGD